MIDWILSFCFVPITVFENPVENSQVFTMTGISCPKRCEGRPQCSGPAEHTKEPVSMAREGPDEARAQTHGQCSPLWRCSQPASVQFGGMPGALLRRRDGAFPWKFSAEGLLSHRARRLVSLVVFNRVTTADTASPMASVRLMTRRRGSRIIDRHDSSCVPARPRALAYCLYSWPASPIYR